MMNKKMVRGGLRGGLRGKKQLGGIENSERRKCKGKNRETRKERYKN